MKPYLLSSIGLHIACLGIFLFLANYHQPLKLEAPKIQVRLSKLGKPRDEKLLPRIEASEAPKPKPTPPAPKKVAQKKEAPKKKEIQKKQVPTPLELLNKLF